ncbi:MAG: CHAD domain-containing protein [Ignavibacteriaceae bacterium]|jgi:CHAD domain-containing protein|nr:CHAD domain-containing protein [Ignavibacteriaceae bacterium]MCU0413281.1 CHAD domain-containing protein [Ignavibacteriaceae bacterium]
MSYCLENNETLSFGLKRIVLELIDKSVFNLSKGNGSFNEDVHDTRKNFKKIRTVLRLIRSEIGEEKYKIENAFYRDAGRTLSDLRDSTVLILTFDKLAKSAELEMSNFDFSVFRDFLVEKHKTIRTAKSKKSAVINSLSTDLLLARSRVFDWPLSGDDFKLIKKNLQQIYEQGQKYMYAVFSEAVKENVHEWRKRVKDLWYAMRILSNLWPEIMSPLVTLLGKLSDTLGDANDLFLLKERIISNQSKFKDDQHTRELINFIDRRIIDLLRDARSIGRKVYSEDPKFFVGRMQNYFEIWRSEYNPLKYSSV